MNPNAILDLGDTKPAAGVMQTKPKSINIFNMNMNIFAQEEIVHR